MERRAFLGAVTGGLLAVPLVAEAKQEPKTYRVGILSPHKAPTGPVADPFATRLAELGWKIEYVPRHADRELERLPALAADLVRLNVDVIFTDGRFATKAAKDATSLIPIVFAGVTFPVERGFVASLARPGGNVTGASDLGGDIHAKLIQFITETVPNRSRVGYLVESPGYDLSGKQQIDEMAQRRALTMVWVAVNGPADLDAAFDTLSRERAGALIVPVTPVLIAERDRVGRLALHHRLPTFTAGRGMIEAGLLMSYHADWSDVLRQAANQVDRILRGAKPADLPVVQPTKFEFLINMRTAKSLGLTIPPSVLLRADEVMQ